MIGHDTSPAKVERWRRIAKSAAQQSGRTRVADVLRRARLGRAARDVPRATTASTFRGSWPSRAPLRDVFEAELAGVRSVLIVIGPEGGFAADEVARAHDAGARAISLGPRILRTETAALVVLASLLYARGEL